MISILSEKARSFFFKPAPPKDPISVILSKPPLHTDAKTNENFFETGKSILSKIKEGIKEGAKKIQFQENLEKLSPDEYRNLCIGLGEDLISAKIIKFLLTLNRKKIDKRLKALISKDGLNMLRHRELSWKDFTNTYISEEAQTPIEILRELLQIQKLEMDFYKQSAEYFKQYALESKEKTPISNPYLYLPPKQETKKTERQFEYMPEPSITLPESDAKIARAAILDAQGSRKKGYSELENNHRTPKEYNNLIQCLDINRDTSKDLAKNTIALWKKYGLIDNDEEYQNLLSGADLHYKIEFARSSFLANCDEMSYLILDYLDHIGYKGNAYIAQINGGNHTFNVIQTEGGQKQLWDAWSNKAYSFDSENIMKHLKNWKPNEKTTGAADHTLEDFNPSRHEVRVFSSMSLENLRLFRSRIIVAQEYEKTLKTTFDTAPSKLASSETSSDSSPLSP